MLTADTSLRHRPPEQEDPVNSSSLLAPSSRSATFRTHALIVVNVGLWYYSNGMNGIAMQSFSKDMMVLGGFHDTSSSFIEIMAVTSALTVAQLLVGVFLGWLVLRIGHVQNNWKVSSLGSFSKDTMVLGGLHGLGSIFTNLGYMYGSAYIVQIIKLMEPFETLALSFLMLPNSRLSSGIVSSMMLVISAAISLLRVQSKKPNPLSIAFATLSGITLSLRNVLQKRHHLRQERSGSDASSKLKNSVVQFTSLSRDGIIVVLLLSVVFNGISSQRSSGQHANAKLFLWHPLYNIFSMIVLGHVSALTHSLLNAGKRVFAIVMALVWFRESFGLTTMAGLVTVAGGACWYAVESKNKSANKQGLQPSKILLALVLVLLLFQAPFFLEKSLLNNFVRHSVAEGTNGKTTA